MSEWRAKTTATAEMEKDLTDGTVFDWVGYLKSHRDIANIVPNGRAVVNFAIVRLAVIDKNTQSGRVDFVLMLDDGHRVRLHPSQQKEAIPVIVPPDRVDIFMMGESAGREALRGTPIEVERSACAAQPGIAAIPAAQPERTHFKGASEADLLMPSQVRLWLTEREQLWPDGKFSQDITSQKEPLAPRNEPLPWHFFVAGVPELKAMQPFAQVWVVWADGPALYFQRQSGHDVVVDLGDKEFNGVTLRRDRVHRCRWRE